MKVLFLILFSSFCSAQNMSFIYELKYHVNIKDPGDFETIYTTLDVVEKNSIFRENKEQIADSTKINKGNPWLNEGFENQFYVKKDLAKNKVSKILTNSEDNFLLPIVEDLNWNISSENKKIGIYNSQKATLSYGGRKWIAWFADDIPINDGPYIFNGLPGLIISIEDSTGDYNFHLIRTKKFKNLFDARLNVSNIDWNKYEQLLKSYYQNPFPRMYNGKVILQDKYGNSLDVDTMRKEMTKRVQEHVKSNNNPIELNHKIDYQ